MTSAVDIDVEIAGTLSAAALASLGLMPPSRGIAFAEPHATKRRATSGLLHSFGQLTFLLAERYSKLSGKQARREAQGCSEGSAREG